MGMWQRHWFTNRRDASSIYFIRTQDIQQELLPSTFLCPSFYAAQIEHQVSDFEHWTDFAKRQKSKFWDTNPELQRQFHTWIQGAFSIFWTARGGWAVWADTSWNTSYLSWHHDTHTEYDILHVQIFFFLKTLQWILFKLSGSVLKLSQWLLGQSPNASRQPLLLFCFFW